MNKVKTFIWKNSITVISFLMLLIIPGLSLAQAKPDTESFSLNGPRMMTIPKTAVYSLTVINTNKNIKKDTRVVLHLPTNLICTEISRKASIVPSKTNGSTSFIWQLGNIEPSKKLVITFKVRAQKTGKILLNAECSDSTQNNPIKVSSTISIVGVPHIKMSCYDTKDPVAVGENTTYVLEVLNDGSSPATNIKIGYQIPKKMKFISAKLPTGFKYITEGNLVTFSTSPILQPGNKITYRIKCTVLDQGFVKSKATLTYDQGEAPLTEEEGTSCFK